MSAPKLFIIKESESQIKQLIKTSSPMIAKRLHALLIFKQNETIGISKRDVAERIGVNHNSVQTWRTAYIQGGVQSLINHGNKGFKPSVITPEQEKSLHDQLHNPQNGFVGFKELLVWFNREFNTDINYKTFHGFVVRKFNAKVKVARKSHVKKDEEAVESLKKTSVKSVKTSLYKKKKTIQ